MCEIDWSSNSYFAVSSSPFSLDSHVKYSTKKDNGRIVYSTISCFASGKVTNGILTRPNLNLLVKNSSLFFILFYICEYRTEPLFHNTTNINFYYLKVQKKSLIILFAKHLCFLGYQCRPKFVKITPKLFAPLHANWIQDLTHRLGHDLETSWP